MSAVIGWQLLAVTLLVVGISLMVGHDGWVGPVGGGMVGGSVGAIGASTTARINEARKAEADRFARLLKGDPR